MALNVWFAALGYSQPGKFKPLMDHLAAHGDRATLLSLANVTAPWDRPCVDPDSFGHPVVDFPVCGYRPSLRRRGRRLLSLRRQGKLADAMRKFLASRDIDTIVFGNDHGVVCGTLVQEARKQGIPTVLMVDGVEVPPNPSYQPSLWVRSKLSVLRLLVGSSPGMKPRGMNGVDLVFVMDKSSGDTMTARGVDASRVRLVGSPELDLIAERARQGKWQDEVPQERARLGLPADRPLVLFIEQPLLTGRRAQSELIATLVSACERCGAVLAVKFHPRSEDPQPWRDWAERRGWGTDRVMFFKREYTVEQLIRLADVCMTVFSTAILEAMIYGKPCVLIQYLDTWLRLNYGRDYGAALDVDRPEDLPAVLSAALNDAAQRDRLDRNRRIMLDAELCGLDGRSAERMRQEILGLVKAARETQYAASF